MGRASEPIAGLRGGHVPGSTNLPFEDVLDERGLLKPKDELQASKLGRWVSGGGGYCSCCSCSCCSCCSFPLLLPAAPSRCSFPLLLPAAPSRCSFPLLLPVAPSCCSFLLLLPAAACCCLAAAAAELLLPLLLRDRNRPKVRAPREEHPIDLSPPSPRMALFPSHRRYSRRQASLSKARS